MTSTAGLTVPYWINPIFQYIFDCLGKRSISKIVAFGDQKIQTSSLRSRCTYNERLFGADFSTVASLGHFSSKMSKEPLLRPMASITVLCSTNFCFQKLKKMTWTSFGFNRTWATYHTANVTIDLLRTVFENRIITRNPDVNYPPRSFYLSQWSQNVGAGGLHHTPLQLMASSSFDCHRLLEWGRPNELKAYMVGTASSHVLESLIWARWTIFCGEPSRLSVTLTIQTTEALKHEIEVAIYGIEV